MKIVDAVFATVANILTRMMVSQDIVKDWNHSEEIQTTVRMLVDFGIPGLVDLYPALSRIHFYNEKRAQDYREINRRTWGDILKERRRKHDVAVQCQEFPRWSHIKFHG